MGSDTRMLSCRWPRKLAVWQAGSCSSSIEVVIIVVVIVVGGGGGRVVGEVDIGWC